MMDRIDVISSLSVKDKCGLCFHWTAVLTWNQTGTGQLPGAYLAEDTAKQGPVFLGEEAPVEDLRAW